MRTAEIAGLELWVGNARQTASYLVHAYGFDLVDGPIAGEDDRSGEVSYLLAQGAIHVRVTGATRRGGAVDEFVGAHGDGVRDIVLAVHDTEDPTTVPAFGATVHSFVPSGSASAGRLRPNAASVPAVGLVAIDHLAVSVEPGERLACVDRYERELGFVPLGPPTIDIDLGESGFTMSSVRAREGNATLVFAEPGHGESQIADFLEENGGPGVHHIAFATDDIVATATALRARQVNTLEVPPTYYEAARQRLGEHELPWDDLAGLGILVDRDEHGLLLQAFTDPIGDRSTLYFEVIQREGATGFGMENVRALYHAVVLNDRGS